MYHVYDFNGEIKWLLTKDGEYWVDHLYLVEFLQFMETRKTLCKEE
ncbi:Hypothetical protein LUCI_3688 [Lucifera butyrica]|uniref:Uncharacterized protein n=1 Tax=Lucifera butyrica TaxID=1351585 RepID=A0A498R6R1_9FIRM|nr:Hypothetical protein LUCI_3688 [Lucifera butyrica]